MGLPGLVWERGLCGRGDNPGQGLQSKPRAGFAGTTPGSTSKQDQRGWQAEPRAKVARVLGQLCEHPRGKVGSQKKRQGRSLPPSPNFFSKHKRGTGSWRFSHSSGQEEASLPPQPRAEQGRVADVWR